MKREEVMKLDDLGGRVERSDQRLNELWDD